MTLIPQNSGLICDCLQPNCHYCGIELYENTPKFKIINGSLDGGDPEIIKQMMTKIKAEIVADSLSPQGDRLTSLLITFPRIILAEVNTHRMLSKNTSSSRAIPFNKMVESISDDPFIPIAFQKHHKGMQGNEYLQGEDLENALDRWNDAKNYALAQAKDLYNTGTTKQLCNRILEPFMWTTMLITGSKEGWDNFFSLRNPVYELKAGTTISNYKDLYFKSYKDLLQYIRNNSNNQSLIQEFEDKSILEKLQINKGHAEIHMMALAEAIYDAIKESNPKPLQAGRWHIPFRDKLPHTFYQEYITGKMSIQSISHQNEDMDKFYAKLSTALAARTSYTVIGDEKELDWKKLLELHDRLISQDPPHSSPMEHCAAAMYDEVYYGGLCDTKFKGGDDFGNAIHDFGWCRNFKGFIPYRAMIEGTKE